MAAPLEAGLYVVATPIGNLRDITLRALEVLASVALIAAEDTRQSRVLLSHHGIGTRMVALHEHNEEAAAAGLVGRIAAGEAIALISDAGTPAVSDPGARVVARVAAAGYRVVPVPGPSALTAAVCVAGLASGRFLFVGFLPPADGARRKALEALRAVPAALVFYEAPHRVAETVDAMAQVLGGGRPVLIARELTKLHESLHRDTLGAAGSWLAADANRLRGEFVLVVDPPPEASADENAARLDQVLGVLLEELPLGQAARLAGRLSGLGRNRAYERALALREAAGDAEAPGAGG